MSAETKPFHVAAILTAMRGRMVCDLGDLYAICSWLAGEDVMTHQLPRVSREAQPVLAEQFPDPAAVDVWAPTIKSWDDVTAWLDSLGLEGTREVAPLGVDHTAIGPLAELRMLRPDAEIIVIRPDGAA